MPYVPQTSRHINTNPKTAAQLRATLAKLAKETREDLTDITEIREVLEILLQTSTRTSEADNAILHGQAVRVSGDGTIDLADASGLSTADVAGVALEDIPAGATGDWRSLGVVEKPGWGLTPGSIYYLSTTSGEITTTSPTSAGDVTIVIGRALSDEELLVKPERSVLL